MSLMAAPSIYTDVTGVQWVIHKAFLEIAGAHQHVLLLVSDVCGLAHHVVYKNNFVGGHWELMHVSHYSIEIESDNVDDVPHCFTLHRRSATTVWVRQNDSRFFIEARDVASMINAYPSQASGTHHLPSRVVGNTYSDVAGNQWNIHKAFVEVDGEFRNVLLLIVSSELAPVDTRRVVFQNKFVNGYWETVHEDHYRIRFNCNGINAKAKTLDYLRQSDTSVWKRANDNRIFVESLDVQAIMAAFLPRESV